VTVCTKAAKRRSKLSGAYLAEFDKALAWAALPTNEKAESPAVASTHEELSPDLA
jgi:hypothetical protein